MFERYTESARRVISFARYEASAMGSPQVEPEHLLLAIMREDRNLVERVMAGKRAVIEQRIRETRQPREHVSTVDSAFSVTLKRVLAYGAEEAERAGQKWIGADSMLLGIFRQASCARTILEECGLDIENVREAVITGTNNPAANFSSLQNRFAKLIQQLQPEDEPAFTFLP